MLNHIINIVKSHIELTGLLSISTMSVGAFILSAFQVLCMGLGAIVALITIYSFLEKKDLLPKWLQRPNKK